MTVTTSWRGRILVAALHGELDLVDSEGLRPALEDVARAEAAAIVLDISGVTYIASVGIGILISLAKKVRARGMQLRLAGPTAAIKSILQTVQIESILPIDASIDQAVQILADHKTETPVT